MDMPETNGEAASKGADGFLVTAFLVTASD